jgi:hypothetical protein
MTYQDIPARDAGPADLGGPRTETADRPAAADAAPGPQASPWDDIPPELVYCLGGYDTDSAGGCG